MIPGVIDQLREALREFDAAPPGEMFPPEGSREAAANTLGEQQ